jgi:hypothetical protein
MSEKFSDNNGIIHDRKKKGLNDLQWSTKHYTENKRSSNMNSTNQLRLH